MKKNLTVAALAVLLSATAGAVETEVTGSAKAGQSKVAMCIGCHGIAEYRTAFPEVYRVPLLGGQNAKYIQVALQGYKHGDRKYSTMHALAASLSEQDMADIAEYYAAQKPFSPNNPDK
ncbi:cytochrome c [Mycoavidus sp. B2-EB]|uniref:c-type cytochrome n=1 Tax=Mycoavidus sp. B2-EB TaxID=2651972 RepID=UPI00162A4D7F|nr:cytochrome c [Mycoavidus sp. B2-EB]BBO59364.1 cytochrome c [Mycoavidus sp. B2-EB]